MWIEKPEAESLPVEHLAVRLNHREAERGDPAHVGLHVLQVELNFLP